MQAGAHSTTTNSTVASEESLAGSKSYQRSRNSIEEEKEEEMKSDPTLAV
jgi:hypothetical protein